MGTAGKLECTSEILRDTPQGPILRVAVAGTHEDGVGHAIGTYLGETLAHHHPAAVVLDFLRFEYRFGDDLGVILQVVVRKDSAGQIARRPSAIVAAGRTGQSLLGLLSFARLEGVFGERIFPDVDSAVEYLAGETGAPQRR